MGISGEPRPMTVAEALGWGAARLVASATPAATGPEARLEAELLLGRALALSRARLYARLGEQLPPASETAYRALVERRLAHEPTAYILGWREFYGLELAVSPAALIPRPETELLVEEALARVGAPGRAPLLADIGTGCGAIALALAAHLPGATIYATDVSGEALALARFNAERLGVGGVPTKSQISWGALGERVRFLLGDLLAPLPEAVDLLVANLPYVPSSRLARLAPEVRDWEPHLALDGGPEGLALVGPFLRRAPGYLRPGGAVIVEIDAGQGAAAAALAQGAFPDASVEVKRDWAGHQRLLVIDTRKPRQVGAEAISGGFSNEIASRSLS